MGGKPSIALIFKVIASGVTFPAVLPIVMSLMLFEHLLCKDRLLACVPYRAAV